MLKNNSIFRGLVVSSTFLLGLSIYGGEMLETNKIMVDQTLGTKSSIIVTDTNDDTLFKTFVPDSDLLTDGKLDPEKWDKAHKDAAVALQEEGTVLLTNKNKALPLTGEKPKVTFFGTRSGSLANQLADEFDVNPTVKAIYGTRASTTAPSYANNKMPYTPFDNKELSPADLAAKDAAYQDSFAAYNDAAIVVFGRQNAEGADYKKGADAVKAENESRNSLASTKAEREIIALARANFGKVILLVETVSQMELGDYIDDVDAILYVGLPDGQGSSAKGIAHILKGSVNPSGGLYDIYASHSESSPAMVNVGLYEYANKDDIGLIQNKSMFGRQAKNTKEDVLALIEQRRVAGGGRIDTSSIGTGGTDFGFYNYLVEAEGLYVGYRYYETRYEDCVLNQGNAKSEVGKFDSVGANWNYADEVDFGFGFGLSYTTFDFSMGNVTLERNGKHEVLAKFEVTVKNTGSVAGKTPIQIYSQSPYTQYDKENLVEKSSIQLVTFEKSSLLQPGESKTYPVIVDLQDVASYDEKGKGTYILENSDDYYFSVGNGAHDALNNILAAKGKTTADGMDYNGSAKAAKKWSYASSYVSGAGAIDDFTFAYSKTGEKIVNQLDHNTLDEFGIEVTELSRQDWKKTWPKEYTGLVANAAMLKDLKGDYFGIKTKENRDVTEEEFKKMFDQPSDLKFSDFRLADYDDYRWKELIDHMSFDETLLYAIESGRGFAAVDSIGVPEGSFAENGAGLAWLADEGIQAPWKIAKPDGASYPNQTINYFNTYAIWACSFNREIVHRIGTLMGNDAILGDKPCIWIPGANTHRTPYGGRASQYFCEDPVLTGVLTMELAHGALLKGGIITAKHFAFNDQEAGRSGISPFINEQRAREVELRAFQIPVEMSKYDTETENVSMYGIMTSFSKIGTVECTTSYGLMTNILQKEWGFHGYLVSDLKDDLDIMPSIFAAGHTGYDWRTFDIDVEPWLNAEDFKYDYRVLAGLKEACHKKLWAFAHTPLMNLVNRSTHSEWNMTWWRGVYIGGRIAFGVIAGLGVAMYALIEILKRKGAK